VGVATPISSFLRSFSQPFRKGPHVDRDKSPNLSGKSKNITTGYDVWMSVKLAAETLGVTIICITSHTIRQ